MILCTNRPDPMPITMDSKNDFVYFMDKAEAKHVALTGKEIAVPASLFSNCRTKSVPITAIGTKLKNCIVVFLKFNLELSSSPIILDK